MLSNKRLINFNSKLKATRFSTPLYIRPSETWLLTKFLTKTLPGQTKIHLVDPMSKIVCDLSNIIIHAILTESKRGRQK